MTKTIEGIPKDALRAHRHPLDAAVCELSKAGVDLLEASADAPTCFSGYHPPPARRRLRGQSFDACDANGWAEQCDESIYGRKRGREPS